MALATDYVTDLIPQAEAKILLGVTDGILAGLRKRKAGPYCVKLDDQEQFRYSRSEVESVRDALLTLGKFGLALHAANPLGPRTMTKADQPGERYISKQEAIDLLGVSVPILAGWAAKGIGPRPLRSNLRQPFRYRERDVMELREALQVLSEFSMSLPGVPPLSR